MVGRRLLSASRPFARAGQARRRVGEAVALVGLAGVVAAAAAAGSQPNAVLGQKQFSSAGCGACHMFAAARSKGKIGPDLDAPTLTINQIVEQIRLGGYTILGSAAKKQYPFPMTAFKNKLSPAEIENIAAFVFISRNPKAVPKGASIPITYGGGGTRSHTTTPTATTTTPSGGGGGGGGGLANNGCPAGQTIQTSGATDNDGDEGGAPSDNDGCI